MGFSLVGGGNSNIKVTFGQYSTVAGGLLHSATETRVQRVIHYAGTFSQLGSSISGLGTGRTLRVRKNQANANQNLSFTNSVVETKYDAVNSDSFAVNDKLNLLFSGSVDEFLYFTKMVYLPDNGKHVGLYTSPTYTNASTAYIGLQGGGVNATESNVQSLMRTSGTLKFAAVAVTIAGAHTVTSRKNGAAGTISIVVPAGSTGIFEDVTHSDTFVSGDLLCFQQTSNGTGEATVASQIEYNVAQNEVIGGSDGSVLAVTSTDHFWPIVNAANKFPADSTNGATARLQHGFGVVASRMRVHVLSNVNTGATTIALRKNAADANQFVTIPASQTGWFEDTTHNDVYNPTDLINYRIASTGTGNITFSQFMITEVPQDSTTGSNLTVASPALSTPTISQNVKTVGTGIAVGSPVLAQPVVQAHEYFTAGFATVPLSLDQPLVFQEHHIVFSNLAVSSPVLRQPTVVNVLIEQGNFEVSSPTLGMPSYAIHVLLLPASPLAVSSPQFTTTILNPPYVTVGFSVGAPVIPIADFEENSQTSTEDLVTRPPVIGAPTLGLVLAAVSLVVHSPGLGSSKVRHFPKFIAIPPPQSDGVLYDATLDIWPDLKYGRLVLMPARVGVDRRTGKMLVGWPHVVQSMQTIFATRYHERVLRRWVGSFVPHLLGDSATRRVVTRFYWAIATSIDLYEPNYRIKKVLVSSRADRTSLTSIEELQTGNLTTRMEGIYRPRAHLGDETPETRRALGLVGRGNNVWDRA